MKKDVTESINAETTTTTGLLDDLSFANTTSQKLSGSQAFERNMSGERCGTRSLKKKGFLDSLCTHMSAVAYAEEGEYDAALDLVTSSKSNSSVLLVIEGTTPANSAIDYALNLCRRTGSRLNILQVIESSKDDYNYIRLGQALTEVSQNIVELLKKVNDGNVPVNVTIRLGDVNQKLINYAKRHHEVSMVVLDSPKIRMASERDRTWKRMIQQLAQRLSVPLITVDYC